MNLTQMKCNFSAQFFIVWYEAILFCNLQKYKVVVEYERQILRLRFRCILEWVKSGKICKSTFDAGQFLTSNSCVFLKAYFSSLFSITMFLILQILPEVNKIQNQKNHKVGPYPTVHSYAVHHFKFCVGFVHLFLLAMKFWRENEERWSSQF